MVFWSFCWVQYQVQIWLLSQLYSFPGFLCGSGYNRISPFWCDSLRSECLAVWLLEGYPLFYSWEMKVQKGNWNRRCIIFSCLSRQCLVLKFFWAGFGSEYGIFVWKAFFACFILEYSSTFSSIAIFGVICINGGVIGIFFWDAGGFLLMWERVSGLFSVFG